MVPYFRQLGRKMEILVVEKSGTGPFNRVKIYNAVIREIMKASNGDQLSGSKCFAFHDVDKLPVNLDVPYSCTTGPHQLLRIFHYDGKTSEAYSTYLGGVTMFSMDQLERINGASNSFEGWGGEDDDLWRRTQMAGMKVVKPDKNKGQFFEINYEHARDKNPRRWALLNRENQESIMWSDGLRQVNYTLRSRVNYNTFVWLLLDL
nr:UDP Gal:betaGlcNAc beta 14 [Hymenolepis microstoma]